MESILKNLETITAKIDSLPLATEADADELNRIDEVIFEIDTLVRLVIDAVETIRDALEEFNSTVEGV